MNLIQILNECSDLKPILTLIKNGVLPLFQIGIPVLLILFGTIDLGKAVIASDDKAIKAATSQLIKRAIAAIAVFFVTTLVVLIMNLVADNSAGEAGDSKNWWTCWNQVSKK